MTEDNIEQYELKEIFSPEMINQRRAKLCTVCGRTVACCVWKSTIGFSCWKYCLDCQDDNFPDWRYEWNSFLSSCGVSLSQDQIAEIVARCSKNLTFEMPEFPLLSASDDSTCQINYPSVTDEIDRLSMLEDPYSSSLPALSDITFSPHNDPIGSPTNTPLKRKAVADLDRDDKKTLSSTNTDENAAISYCDTSQIDLSPAAENRTKHSAFLNLPATSKYCLSVDTVHGKFYVCAFCGEVPVRKDQNRAFTIGRWKEHESSVKHKQLVVRQEEIERIDAKKRLGNTELSTAERTILGNRTKNQTSVLSYFVKKQKTTPTSTETSILQREHQNPAPTNNSTSFNALSTKPLQTPTSAFTANNRNPSTCQGIVPKFRENEFQLNAEAFMLNGAISQDARYKMGLFAGKWYTVFAVKCSGVDGSIRHDKSFQCEHCFIIRSNNSQFTKIKALINRRGKSFRIASELITRVHLTSTDYSFMNSFTRTEDIWLSQRGCDLKRYVSSQMDYYKSVQKCPIKDDICGINNGNVPCEDKFLSQFVSMYQTNAHGIQCSLVTLLLKALVTKMSGKRNVKYDDKVRNFFIALAASGNKQAYEFVSGNLGQCMTLRHAKRMIAVRRSSPFIDLEDREIKNIIQNYIGTIREKFGDVNKRVVFTVGVDATVLVKTFQYSPQLEAIIGGVYPNHRIDVSGKSNDEISKVIKDCIDGKYGAMADEVKACVVSFQNTPVGMCPYLVVAGNAQTVNESNLFGKRMVTLSQEVTKSIRNSAVLNQTTDGVSCEVQWNMQTLLDYLDGLTNVCSLPDPNHNAKCCRFQLVGGSCAACIGNYVVDPFLLQEAGVAKELYRPQDYASDAVVLRLCSHDTLKKLIENDSADTGNVAVTIVSLLMMRMRLFAVNSRTSSWRVRAAMIYMSTVWFTSFQSSGNKDNPHTMLPNKRNMLLETISLLFLVTRDDVSQPRRLTSEANEHTYGCWRMTQSDFNLEQLIGIVDKTKIRFDAIYSSGLVTARSNCTLKGYLSTFREYVETLKQAASKQPSSGPVVIDDSKAAVHQLWDEVKGVIEAVNTYMKPFLQLFGIEEGNGLSPLVKAQYDSPADIRSIIVEFFKPPSKDPRDSLPDTLETNDNLATQCDEDDMRSSGMELDVITAFNAFHLSTSDDSNNANQQNSNNEEDDMGMNTINLDDLELTSFFRDTGDDGDEIFAAVKELLNVTNYSDIQKSCLKVMSYLDLGRLEKGSLLFDTKQKSFQQRWMGAKAKRGQDKQKQGYVADSLGCTEEIVIQRDSLVSLHCRKGNTTIIEHYRVLCPFTKYYNKWYVCIDETKFVWKKNSKNVRFLVRMMRKIGSSYEEVKLEKNGEFGPRCVFRICSMNEILDVMSDLVEF